MSKPAKFTNGPWSMCHRGESLKGVKGTDVVIWGCGLVNGQRTDEADANSALIWAAPEMYKMLEVIATSMHKTDSGSIEDILNIEAMLAKARGEL
jgi:hypothetical protein